jgi:hypothetical protein
VSTAEESHLADFLADVIARNGAAPHTVHPDRGTSMTSKPVSALLTDRHQNASRRQDAYTFFGGRPRLPAMPTQAWINQPEAQPQTELNTRVPLDLSAP